VEARLAADRPEIDHVEHARLVEGDLLPVGVAEAQRADGVAASHHREQKDQRESDHGAASS
jgi:hypothetical protein